MVNDKVVQKTPGTDEVVARWASNSRRIIESYGPQGDKVREHLINRDIFALLGGVGDLRVLEAGCGEGYLCRLLAQLGAQMVVGLDLCVPLLSRARELESVKLLGVTYVWGDYQHMREFADGSFNKVVSNMVLMDLPDYRSAIRETARVLVPGGTFVFSILHPAFITPSGDWCRAADGDKAAWHVDQYFDRRVSEQTFKSATSSYRFSADESPPFMFHRPLSDYFEALAAAGFVVTGLKEAEPPGSIRDDSDAAPGEGRISWYLTVRAEKLRA